MNAEGWYEFHRLPAMTTHIAHVAESGYIYVPEAGVTDEDFLNAALAGHAYRLERAEAPQPPIPSEADWQAVRDRIAETEEPAVTEPTWSRGSWMQTFTGRAFYPTHPDPYDVDILDIAHALSLLCRYNGHVSRFYSVAEHCVLLSGLVAPEHALWALLHDATEAYVGDMVRPLKQHQPDYVAAEDRVMMAIALRFELTGTGHRVTHPQYRLGEMVGLTMPEEVKAADTRILLDERDALLSTPPQAWAVDGEPFGVTIDGWPPALAEARYLERFHELTEGRFA